jgi:S1-C subfamily serine protease
VLIAKVMPNSPAAKAGLRAGDVIQKINGQPVKDAEGVQKSVESTQVGSNLQLELRRNQKDMNVTVQPGAVPTRRQ